MGAVLWVEFLLGVFCHIGVCPWGVLGVCEMYLLMDSEMFFLLALLLGVLGNFIGVCVLLSIDWMIV